MSNKIKNRKIIIDLARSAITEFLLTGKIIAEPTPLPVLLTKNSAVFVTIYIQQKRRGSIGTFVPSQQNLAQEIIFNAISAAVRDPRYPRITRAEIPDIKLTVDLLLPFEQVFDITTLDPDKFGVLVQKDSRYGLVLPREENIENALGQVELALTKAMIDEEEEFDLFSFQVERYMDD